MYRDNIAYNAKVEDIETVEYRPPNFSDRAGETWIGCYHPECKENIKTSPQYMIFFNKEKVGGVSGGCEVECHLWVFCEDHLPPNLKHAPQVKVARFATRSKGRA